MKIFGRRLKEYLWPIRIYILFSILIVISQYYIALPLSRDYPYILNLTQGLWAIMVILSVIKLSLFYNFKFKNILFLGILYSFIIHGLKAFVFRIFLFPYSDPTPRQYFLHLLNRFLYGSFLVMVIVIILGLIFIKLKKDEKTKKLFKWME